MSKEELIEMVNATINENGKREITGKNLNLALMQIIEAMGESGGAGGVTVYIAHGTYETDAWWDVSELEAKNAAVIAQLKELVLAGKTLPPITVDYTYASTASFTEDHKVPAGVCINYSSLGALFDETGQFPILGNLDSDPGLYVLIADVFADGSLKGIYINEAGKTRSLN